MDKQYSFIFDIGRVLMDFDFDRAFERLEKASPYSLEEVRERMFTGEGRELNDDYELGKIDSRMYYRVAQRLLEVPLDYEEFAEVWSDIFTPNEKIAGFLERIVDRPKAIVSNTCALHWEKKLAGSDIFHHFDTGNIIKSYEAGLRKPDAKLYDLAKSRLPAGTEIIYFDDIEAYAQAASKLGIRGIKYDCRTDDLDEVLEKNSIEI